MVGKKLVAVPAYNESGYVQDTLASLKPLNDRPDYEVVLVDDGSTDGTAQVAKDMGYPVLSHETNLGKTKAELTAVEYARENGFEYVAFIDADTLNLRPDMVDSLMEPLIARTADGRPRKLMTVAHMQEGREPVEPSDYDLRYCGQRAFRVQAFDPYFNGNRKWMDYLEVRWPEPAYQRLFTESQTQYLPELTFIQRPPYHGGSDEYFSTFMDSQSDSVNYPMMIHAKRRMAASSLSRKRSKGKEEVYKLLDEEVDALRGHYPAGVGKKPPKKEYKKYK